MRENTELTDEHKDDAERGNGTGACDWAVAQGPGPIRRPWAALIPVATAIFGMRPAPTARIQTGERLTRQSARSGEISELCAVPRANRRGRTAALLALGMFCGLLGSAVESHAQARWSFSAYGGAVHSVPAAIGIEQLSTNSSLVFDDVTFTSRSFESPIYYGYRIGRRVAGVQWLWLEAELIHAKLYVAAPAETLGRGQLHGVSVPQVRLAEFVQEFNLSHGMNFVLANAVARRGLLERLTGTARGGVGAMLPHVESETAGQRRGDYQLAGVGAQLAGGVEFALARSLLVVAEYKWTVGRQHVSLASGDARLTVISHHVTFGVATAF